MPVTDWLRPDWPAPPGVQAVVTTRVGGASHGPYASLNLASHVGDEPAAVAENRRRLRAALDLPAEPAWLAQMYGIHVAVLSGTTFQHETQADASVCVGERAVCAILTADCLPVLFCNRARTAVAAAHAGWRGLAAGVLEAAVAALKSPPGDILAWLGPAIGPAAFEVGEEVRAAFLSRQAAAAAAFQPGATGKWHADLYALARLRLAAAGVTAVYGGGWCTHTEAQRFFSYRRDGITGRMASLIWLA